MAGGFTDTFGGLIHIVTTGACTNVLDAGAATDVRASSRRVRLVP